MLPSGLTLARLTWDGSKFSVVFQTKAFKSGAVRCMRFSVSGKYIICGSSKGKVCLLKAESGKVKMRIDHVFASKSPIGSIISLDEQDKLFAFGNDDGDVKIMDLKNVENPTVVAFDDFDDQVTDMLHLAYRKTLICSSGDGTILVIDLKKNKLISHSQSFDDEISCLSAVKNGSKILCGTGMGEINIFCYNYWGTVSDRLPQHPGTVSCMLAEGGESNIIYTGCSDGIIRRLSVYPSEVLAEMERLDDSVESLALFKTEAYSMLLVATCNDAILNVIDLAEEAADDQDSGNVSMSKRGKRKLPIVNRESEVKKAFFADL